MNHYPSAFFQDLLVVELASVLAGPALGQFFAELGARVIKVENQATGGDVTRRWKAPTESAEQTDSAYYHSINYGKESVMLNLKEDTDRQQVYEWLKQADIVVVNYRPGAAEKLGMDYETVTTLNPQIIYAELNGFGPDDRRPAFDVVLQAETGFLYLTGEPGRPPVKMPVALIDLLAAHQLKEGVLMALLKREKSGRGARVSTSLYDAAVASLANQATNWLIAGYSPQALGTQHPNIAPYGDLFTSSDDQRLVLAVGTEKHFKDLCKLVGQAALAEDERFATNAQRVTHREELVAHLRPLIAQWKRDDFLAACHRQSIPAGAVRDLPDVFSQPAAQRILLHAKNEAGEAIRSVRTAVFAIEENQ